MTYVFIISLVFLSYYTEGDQLHYRRVYSELSELGLIEGYFFYNVNLSSFEYVHFLFSWFFSRVMEKDYFIALSNVLLAWGVIRYFDKQRVLFIVTAAFVISNFYLLVLFYSAERLKFGMMFFVLSMYYSERLKLSVILSLLAVSSHVQFFIIYGGVLFNNIVNKVIYLFRTGKLSLSVLYMVLFSALLVLLMWSQIYIKFTAYFSVSNWSEHFRLLIFLLMALWYSNKKQETLLVFLPLFVGVALFGGDRINMFGYFVFLYYALQVNRGINIGVLITSLYFAYASYGLLINIVEHGDGFYAG